MTSLSHDEIVRRLRAARAAVSLAQGRDAFVASLSSAPVRFRTVLARVAFATNFPEHAFQPSDGEQSYLCRVCGMSKREDLDRDENAAFRAKGDYSFFDPVGAMLDLEDFVATPMPAPTGLDAAVYERMLDAAEKLPKTARASALLKAWSFVPRTNKYARENLIATLGACGVFATIDHPSHLARWVGSWEYEETPGTAGDMRPPEAWWTRADGVDREGTRIRKRAIAKKPSKVGKIELAPGDRIGLAYQGRHFVGVVLGAHSIKKRALPIVEFYGETWRAWPTEKQLAKASPRLVGPHHIAPAFRREPLALDGLELYGKVMRDASFEVLAHESPIATKLPLPAYGYRVVAPKNMLFILDTLAITAL